VTCATMARRTLPAALALALVSVVWPASHGASPAAAAPRSATITDEWWTNPDTLDLTMSMSPTLGDEVFDRVQSFQWDTAIPDGWATTPYVNYGSYAAFQTDVAAGNAPDVPWLMYDPEMWSRGPSELQGHMTDGADVRRLRTPSDEQLHPSKYMKLFAQLGHDNGYRVINAPGLNLVEVPGADCTQANGESEWDAYLRCNLAGNAAAQADEIDIQAQEFECPSSGYADKVSRAAGQARTKNPSVKLLAGLSTGWCQPDGDTLYADWQAVSSMVDGHFLVIGDGNPQAGIDFLAQVAPVIVSDEDISPADQVVCQGTDVAWRVSWAATRKHSITDATGMGLFDSGLQSAGFVLRYELTGGGIYTIKDTKSGHTATVTIPVLASPPSGGTTTTFSIQASTIKAPKGFVFETQVERPGSTTFVTWKSGPTNTFVPDAGTGTYSFRAHLKKKSTGATSGWSPDAPIQVA
jgi:hypothetical protein